jgi:putative ABC transport system permease protein
MKTHFLKLAFRNFNKNKSFILINIFGLTTAIATFILISVYLKHETSWDKFNENYENIYRLEPEIHIAKKSDMQYLTQTPWPAGEQMKESYSEVKNYVCLRETWGEYLATSRKMEPVFEQNGYYTSNRVFEVYTLPFIEGSPDKALTEPNSIVLTKKVAEKFFPGERALGKTLIADNKHTYRVTGVIENPPSNFHLDPSYFVSISSFKTNKNWDIKNNWHTYSSRVYVELHDHVDINSFSKKIRNFLNEYNNKNTKATLHLNNLARVHLQPSGSTGGLMTIIYLFGFSTVLILFLGGINFTNLTTAYLSTRYKEVGIKKVMGGNRWSIIKEIVGESLIITLIALILGFSLAELTLPTFKQVIGRELNINYTGDWQLILFIVLIALVTGVIAALQPALKYSAFSPVEAIKGRRQSDKKPPKKRLSKVLTTFQLFISITFVLFALNTYEEVKFFINKEMGFNKENLLVCSIDRTDNVKVNNWETLQNELTRHTGVKEASISYHAPYHGSEGELYSWEGAMADEKLMFMINWIDNHFIETYDMEIVRGRNFSKDRASDEEACIINETAAKSIGWDDPIGKTINGKYRVIGVVKDYHKITPYIEIMPIILFRHKQDLSQYKHISVRTNPGNFRENFDYVNETLESYFPDVIFNLHTMEDRIKNDDTTKIYKGLADTFAFFAVIAIAIAIVGLFALVAFSTKKRVKEIGIRKVMGATSSTIYQSMVLGYLKYYAIASILAVAADFLLAKTNPAAYKPDVNPMIFILTLVGALVVILLTISYQIIKTAHTNPARSLRDE